LRPARSSTEATARSLPPVPPVPEAAHFSLDEFTVEAEPWALPAGLPAVGLAGVVARLVDPGSAVKTLHWGRNYLYVARLDTAGGPLEVVVKQFRNKSLRDRLRRRRRGSKAALSWQVARALAAAGVATPAPVMLVESVRECGPSFYVCRYLPDVLEARYLLRAANAGRERELFPGVDLAAFLAALGHQVRRLHEHGFWHRDLSIGNVLLRPPGLEGEGCEIYLVDLNRTRMGRPLSLSERTRDLARLAIFRREHQRIFLAAYWGGEAGGDETGARGEREAQAGGGWRPALRRRLRQGLYLAFHHGFRWKNRAKQALRGQPGVRGGTLWTRAPHAHIPDAPHGAAPRDKAVWDHLSHQPHQHAGRLEKLRMRAADARVHAGELATVAAALPRVWRRYRQLRRGLYSRPTAWGGAGVCLRPGPEGPEAQLVLLEELGARQVLLRLHPWEHDAAALAAEDELAAELHRRGYELTFAVPQNRELVRDPGRFQAALESIAERLLPYGRRFQIGQAINRSKWGIWHAGEYAALARAAETVLRRHPGVELLGPAVIDFEYHVTAAVLNLRQAGFRFDIVSSLLYVDRRGAPENRQAGFDTVAKVALLKAIAETARNSSGRCWITEVNWPLWEGPHSPAGRAVAVDEATQADYLARYLLLTLGTGLVERVFWWQLVARGYGLVDPAEAGRLRRRPSFFAFKTLVGVLEGSTLLGLAAAQPGAYLYHFRRADGEQVVAGWTLGGEVTARLPRPARWAVGRDGEELLLSSSASRDVLLTPSPRYFWLAEE
jgi:tRNA A-37 threonylcarbamoyl transferase component Bud32